MHPFWMHYTLNYAFKKDAAECSHITTVAVFAKLFRAQSLVQPWLNTVCGLSDHID